MTLPMFGWSESFQVTRVYARAVSAGVVNIVTIWDWPQMHLPRYSVAPCVIPTRDNHNWVAILGFSARAFPAIFFAAASVGPL
jgi:hypothetical protein